MPATLIWWSALCAAALLNVAAWFFSAQRLALREAAYSGGAYEIRRTLLWLSAVYVAGCRSVFPMVDVPRTCLHDTWVSRIFVDGMVATAAELAFSLVLLLKEAGVRIVATDSLAGSAQALVGAVRSSTSPLRSLTIPERKITPMA